MYRRAFSSQHAVPLTLFLMVADQTADCGQRIIFKKLPPRLIQTAVQHQPDDRRNRCMDRAALLTLRVFTVQTAVRFVQYMCSHILFLLLFSFPLNTEIFHVSLYFLFRQRIYEYQHQCHTEKEDSRHNRCQFVKTAQNLCALGLSC